MDSALQDELKKLRPHLTDNLARTLTLATAQLEDMRRSAEIYETAARVVAAELHISKHLDKASL